MRSATEPPTSRRARAWWVLACVAALEAVVIVVLLLTRPSDVEPDLPRAPRGEPAAGGSGEPLFAVARTEFVQSAGASVPRIERATTSVEAFTPTTLSHPGAGALGIILCGSVTGAAGEPAEGASLHTVSGSAEDDSNSRRTSTEHGLFALAGMSPGAWRLSCEDDGALPQTIDVVLDAGRPIERVDFVLARAPRVPVRFVTPDGRRLREALHDAQLSDEVQTYLTLQPLSSPVAEDVTRVGYATRGFTRTDPDPQTWDKMLVFAVPLPAYVSAVWEKRVLASQLVTAESPGVTFTLSTDALSADLGSVRVRVVDALTRGPVTGALVRVGDRHTEVDAEGVVLLERLLPAAYQLEIHAPGSWAGLSGSLILSGNRSETDYGGESFPIELRPGEQLDLGEVPLQRTIAVRGRVVDEGGHPVAIWVRATQLDQAPRSEANTRERATETDPSDGSFTLRMSAGRWAFRAFDRSRASASEVREVHAPLDDVQLVANSTVPVLIDFTRASSRTDWQIVIKDRNDLPVASTPWSEGDSSPWMSQLIVGEYRLEVQDADGSEALLSSTPLSVGRASVRLTLALP